MRFTICLAMLMLSGCALFRSRGDDLAEAHAAFHAIARSHEVYCRHVVAAPGEDAAAVARLGEAVAASLAEGIRATAPDEEIANER